MSEEILSENLVANENVNDQEELAQRNEQIHVEGVAAGDPSGEQQQQEEDDQADNNLQDANNDINNKDYDNDASSTHSTNDFPANSNSNSNNNSTSNTPSNTNLANPLVNVVVSLNNMDSPATLQHQNQEQQQLNDGEIEINFSAEIPQLSETEIREQLTCKLKAGEIFLKHCRVGKPHRRFVYLSEDGQNVCWVPVHLANNSNNPSARKATGQVAVSSITQIQLGQTTPVFAKKGKRNRDKYSFSLICQERTLDLETITQEDRDDWAEAFRVVINPKT